jgi:hypothetical protein
MRFNFIFNLYREFFIMAFTANTFQFNRGVTTCATNGAGVGTVIHSYKNTIDTGTVILTPGYFPDNIDNSTDKIFVDDLLLIVSADTVSMHQITALVPFSLGADLFAGAGSPIVMSVPVAATDANAIKITGTTVQMEIADATHPGIVTALNQDFAGIKMFNSGLKLLTTGGTPTTLNYYEEYTHTTTFTLNVETTTPVAIKVVRCGAMVILKFPIFTSVPGQATTGARFSGNTALPARFRPPDTVKNAGGVTNGGIESLGAIVVDAFGAIFIYHNWDVTTPFPSGVINGFGEITLAYLII